MGKASDGWKYLIGGTLGCLVLLLGCCAGCAFFVYKAMPSIPKHVTRDAVADHYATALKAVEKRIDDGLPMNGKQWQPPDGLLAVYETGGDALHFGANRDLLGVHEIRIHSHTVINGIGIAKADIDNRSETIVLYGLDRGGGHYLLALRDWDGEAK